MDTARAITAIQVIQPEDQAESQLLRQSDVLVAELLRREPASCAMLRPGPLGPRDVEALIRRVAHDKPSRGRPHDRGERRPDRLRVTGHLLDVGSTDLASAPSPEGPGLVHQEVSQDEPLGNVR